MGIAAAVVAVIGLLALVGGALKKMEANGVSGAPLVSTGDAASRGSEVANSKGAIAVQGRPVAQQMLHSPVTNTPCLYFSLEVIGEWGKGEDKDEKHYVDHWEAADFGIDDGSGAVGVTVKKESSFDAEQSFKKRVNEGMLSDFTGAGGEIQFENYTFHNPRNSVAERFTCVEKIVRVPDRLYVCGKSDGNKIVEPGLTRLIMSTKTQEELVGGTQKYAMILFGVGALCLAVGGVLGIVAAVSGP